MGRIGKLRQRGRLQRRTVTLEADGGGMTSWKTYATVWCNVVPLAGQAKLNEQKTTGLVEHRVELRWRRDVHPSDRLVLRSREGVDRVLTLTAVTNQGERYRMLVLSATETITPLDAEP